MSDVAIILRIRSLSIDILNRMDDCKTVAEAVPRAFEIAKDIFENEEVTASMLLAALWVTLVGTEIDSNLTPITKCAADIIYKYVPFREKVAEQCQNEKNPSHG